MPTNRTRIRRDRVPEISAYERAWLYDQPETGDPAENIFARHKLTDEGAAELWREFEAEVVAWWVAHHPGTRPANWWRLSAPRQALGTWPGYWFDGTLPAPRLRVGGIGDPDFDHLAIMPRYACGIPATWLDDWWADRLRRDRRGFTGRAYHPGDPPVYEAEAAYLERHGLLFPGERRRLRKRDFEPEAVMLDNEAEAA
jgi:hypothetical protein